MKFLIMEPSPFPIFIPLRNFHQHGLNTYHPSSISIYNKDNRTVQLLWFLELQFAGQYFEHALCYTNGWLRFQPICFFMPSYNILSYRILSHFRIKFFWPLTLPLKFFERISRSICCGNVSIHHIMEISVLNSYLPVKVVSNMLFVYSVDYRLEYFVALESFEYLIL